jgi:anti-sigma-K factor RskA
MRGFGEGTAVARFFSMEWLTWFPSVYWQHVVFGVAMMVVVIALVMAVRPRSRRTTKPF